MLTCHNVADYLVWKAGLVNIPIEHMKLQKLLFFAQAWYLALYKKPLFLEDFQAWKWGPVLPEVHTRFREYKQGKPIPISIEKPYLPDEISKFLDFNFDCFADRNRFRLSDETHEVGSPWYQTRVGLNSEAYSDRVISKEIIKMYYEELIVDESFNDEDENDIVLSQFLDFLVRDLEINPNKLIPYTENMLKEDKELISGVILD